MKLSFAKFLGGLALILASSPSLAAKPPCNGKFPNPITDICWSCMMPIQLGGAKTVADGGQESTDTVPAGIGCACSSPPKVGVKVSFWELMRRVDITRSAYCMVGLGGVDMTVGVDAQDSARRKGDHQGNLFFYQAHWYVDPIMYWSGIILDSNCLENEGFDVGYMTELDPLWEDDELSFILNPDAALFANIPAKLACIPDSLVSNVPLENVMANVAGGAPGFGVKQIYWCTGGKSMFPLTGNIIATGPLEAATGLMARLTFKLHREGAMWAASGEKGMCGYYPQMIMDKTNYKHSMIYPVPQTEKVEGRCCQPYGRHSVFWGAGRTFPYKGEDFSFVVARKRDCCSSAIR